MFHQFSSQSYEMLVAGNTCNCIWLSKKPLGWKKFQWCGIMLPGGCYSLGTWCPFDSFASSISFYLSFPQSNGVVCFLFSWWCYVTCTVMWLALFLYLLSAGVLCAIHWILTKILWYKCSYLHYWSTETWGNLSKVVQQLRAWGRFEFWQAGYRAWDINPLVTFAWTLI